MNALRRNVSKISLGRLPLFALWTVTVGVICLFLIGIPGGFDFTDEGVYYLGFVSPGDIPDGHTSFRFFGAQIFNLIAHDIVAMRICTLLAVMGATSIFLHGWQGLVERLAPQLSVGREHRNSVFAAALTAALLGFAISPAALSYNFQNSFCLLAATGFLLQAAARPKGEKLLTVAALTPLVAFGLLVGVQFFVKFSSSIVLSATGGLFYLLVSEKKVADKAVLCVFLLAVVSGVALVYFSIFQNFTHWWIGIGPISRMVTTGDYTSGHLLRYRDEFLALLSLTVRYFVPIWIVVIPAAISVVALRKNPKLQAAVAVFGGIASAAMLFWLMAELRDNPDINPIGLFYFLGILILLLILVAAGHSARPYPVSTGPAKNRRLILAGAFIFITPYIGSFGTSNNINQNCLYQLAPWFALAGLLLAMIGGQWGTMWPSRIGLVVITAIAAGQFYHGYWKHPYRITGSRSEQTASTPIGDPPTSLRLAPEVQAFITTARACLKGNGFKKGDDLLVFFDLPGFVFAMGGSSPRHHWYWAGNAAALEDSAMHVSLLDPERRNNAFIVRNSGEEWEAFLPALRTAGLPFPDGYRLITPPMTSPFTGVKFEIWMPASSSSN